ncbi:MAG: hypothetical protein KGL09_07610, partial [Pseudomonadota bacterium]|nr:hypothetical protein [Pseudomonadota bacterium]
MLRGSAVITQIVTDLGAREVDAGLRADGDRPLQHAIDERDIRVGRIVEALAQRQAKCRKPSPRSMRAKREVAIEISRLIELPCLQRRFSQQLHEREVMWMRHHCRAT